MMDDDAYKRMLHLRRRLICAIFLLEYRRLQRMGINKSL